MVPTSVSGVLRDLNSWGEVSQCIAILTEMHSSGASASTEDRAAASRAAVDAALRESARLQDERMRRLAFGRLAVVLSSLPPNTWQSRTARALGKREARERTRFLSAFAAEASDDACLALWRRIARHPDTVRRDALLAVMAPHLGPRIAARVTATFPKKGQRPCWLADLRALAPYVEVATAERLLSATRGSRLNRAVAEALMTDRSAGDVGHGGGGQRWLQAAPRISQTKVSSGEFRWPPPVADDDWKEEALGALRSHLTGDQLAVGHRRTPGGEKSGGRARRRDRDGAREHPVNSCPRCFPAPSSPVTGRAVRLSASELADLTYVEPAEGGGGWTRGVDDENRAFRLAELLRREDKRVLPAAVQLLGMIRDEPTRDYVLARMSSELRPRWFTEFLVMAGVTWPPAALDDRRLAELGSTTWLGGDYHVPLRHRGDRSSAGLRKSDQDRVAEFVLAGPRLRERQWKEALSAVMTLQSSAYRAEALRALMPHLPTELVPDAIDLVLSPANLGSPEDRSDSGTSDRYEVLQVLADRADGWLSDASRASRALREAALVGRAEVLVLIASHACHVYQTVGETGVSTTANAVLDVCRWVP